MKYVCSICGYVYDESQEDLTFQQLPESWVCPICKADQSLFVKEEKETKTTDMNISTEGDIVYSLGELAAICSNLQRGCEKQYKDEEALLLKTLSDVFTAHVENEDNASVDVLEQLLQEDLSQHYPALHGYAKQVADRGTQRICVWGEKVTAILHSLLMRYRQDQGAFLKNTSVWVCSVCGFVFVGDEAPELCPVCKVPTWKFEKIEGREAG
ncbi:rubredoxin-like domain-containing protein [Massilimicrobiota timonensis]|uniref:rubredoxin-like domain-containing protein n=1 Tax=Massilimicrobiota timonensis TaxID=1776392 RepID=UPI0019610BC9|nr:rubredoxin [Massilimicrobiota timonensis]MBM6965700.1 rubredoxin [Massilimicrobiota timonensis]